MENISDIETLQKTTLNSGIRVVTEKVDTVKSVTVGIWVKTGSRNETDRQAGVTHFLEHMLFKGTDNRSSYDIAMSMESVGGYLNAFTSSEYTCYYARCLDSKLERALDVLTDMVLRPSFPEEELQKEKKVVIEEMKMYRDSPDDYLFEEFTSQMFRHHPLGRPILGYENTVSNFSREDLYNYMEDRYVPDNLVISVAGNVDHDQVVSQVESLFEVIKDRSEVSNDVGLSKYKVEDRKLYKPIEQTHLVTGRRGLSSNHEDRYRLLLANTILGGGMSSRLHQNVREKYGYCYTISTFNQSYSDTGLFGVYVGTDQEYLDHVKELINKEFDKIKSEEVPQQELAEAKSQLKGKLLLSQESMSSRMSRLAKSELYFDRFVTLDELVEEIDKVTSEDIQTFSESFFDESLFSQAVLLPEERSGN